MQLQKLDAPTLQSENQVLSSDNLFSWKRFTGELLFVFSSASLLDSLNSEDNNEACPCACADDKGLIAWNLNK